MATPENIEFKTVEEKKMVPSRKSNLMIPFVIAIVLGICTGVFLTKQKGNVDSNGSPKLIQTDKIVGSTAKNFKDSAEGVLQKNDSKVITEGTHKLIRGDETQTVYLTSSVLDLDQFIGRKVKVWGETNKGQKAAWLMDVGKVEKLD